MSSIENTHLQKRKRSLEKVYTRKEAADMLKEKEAKISYLVEDLKQAFTKIYLLEQENTGLKAKLQELQNPGDGYRKDWTWVRKIVFVLEQHGAPMRSPEIIEELAKREVHLRNHWNQAQYFSAFLNKALKEERIKREKRGGERGFYYSINI